MAGAASGSTTTTERPRHWDKRVAAAYLRMMGQSQKDAAASVGRSERTVWGWEQEPSWADARAEARDRWMADVEDSSRKAVLDSVKDGNAEMAFRIIERIDSRLAPARQRLEHSGPDGGPIETRDLSDEELKRRLSDAKARLAKVTADEDD